MIWNVRKTSSNGTDRPTDGRFSASPQRALDEIAERRQVGVVRSHVRIGDESDVLERISARPAFKASAHPAAIARRTLRARCRPPIAREIDEHGQSLSVSEPRESGLDEVDEVRSTGYS
jgi:hypothetical protein